MPKSFTSSKGGGSGNVTVGTTTSNGTADTLLKTNSSSQVADATGVTQPSGKTLQTVVQAASDEGVSVKMHASQSGDAIEVVKSDGTTVVFKVTKDGYALIGDGTASVARQCLIRDLNGNNFFALYSGNVTVGDTTYSLASQGLDTRVNAGATGNVTINIANTAKFTVDNTHVSAGVMFNGFKGADVASAAAIAPTGNVFHVTGTTNITSITSTGITAGTQITIIFDGVLTFTDGSNLVLNGNFVTSANDTITLVYDGTNWYEIARSAN